jgi:hypothetical protein
MKEKIKIESINKISQIDSIDVHANSVVCDLKLDVEKIISASSDEMKDINSAKSNAYNLAKAKFGVDVIVDPVYIIKKHINISVLGYIGIILIVGFILNNQFGSYDGLIMFLLPIFGIIFLILGVARTFMVEISGYAGYYVNPRNYYDQQKDHLINTSNAINKAFSETPSLLLEERKILEQINNLKNEEITLNTEQLQVWKKQRKIDNKINQTSLFYSVFYPNSSFPEATTGVSSLLKSKKKRKGINWGGIGSGLFPILKVIILGGVLFFAGNLAYKKYKSYIEERERVKIELTAKSRQLQDMVKTYEIAIKKEDRNNIDSTKIEMIIWDYKPNDFSDSVTKYNQIKSKLMKDFNVFMDKLKAEERKKNIENLLGRLDDVLGDYSGDADDKNIVINISSISRDLKVKASLTYKYYDENDYFRENEIVKTKTVKCTIDFKDSYPIFTFVEPGKKSSDGTYVLKLSGSSFSGDWISKTDESKKRSIWLSKVVEYVEDDYYSDDYYSDGGMWGE